LTEEELKAATEVDIENVVGLVVTVGEGANETIIAGGRYAAFDTANNLRSAEVACFDTSSHHTQPDVARVFALPTDLREAGVMR